MSSWVAVKKLEVEEFNAKSTSERKLATEKLLVCFLFLFTLSKVLS